MKLQKKSLVASVLLLSTTPAAAADPLSPQSALPKLSRSVAPMSEAERYARRCHGKAPSRDTNHQGTLLWGTKHVWDSQQTTDERHSVLVSVDLNAPRMAPPKVKSLRLEKGRLVASPDSSTSLVGTVFQGTSSDGKPVEVTVCAVESAPEDPELTWYRVEAWNPVAQEWENPCVATGHVPQPRALAVGGVWDSSGAHQDAPGKLTLACENGAITKCIRWGYTPWGSRDGQSLASLHQACTRMARADYCGNGLSHTHENTMIDMYDRLGVLARTKADSADWSPSRASFEAAWAPDGATCLARTRDGRALETILQECPGRFQSGAEVDLGDGDRCKVQRPGVSEQPALLRNHSYGATPQGAFTQTGSKQTRE